MKTLDNYTIVIRPDDNHTYVAYVPAIQGFHAWGKTANEARSELNHVFDMIKEEYLEERKSLPEDVKLIIAHAC